MILAIKNATEALELRQQVGAAGLIIHKDYTWCYHPKDDWDYANVTIATVEFNFTNPTWETYFQLKWS